MDLLARKYVAKGKALARIAVVEDDIDMSRLIRDDMRDSGHEVVSYLNPSIDTVEHIRSLCPDLVVLDARLNSTVDGWEIVEALKSSPETDRIPVVLCSAATEEIAQHLPWLEAHQVDVIRKPFDMDDFHRVVGGILKT